MKTSTIAWIIIILVVLAGGWYWWSMQSGNQMMTASDAAQQPSTEAGLNGAEGQTNTGQVAAAAVVEVSQDPKLGAMLVAPNGMTLYKYTKDTIGVSNCSGDCATNWPPYTVSGTEPLMAGAGATGTLATIARADGTMQVTYNGLPLYYWAKDAKPGDTTGQAVGKVWYVVAP